MTKWLLQKDKPPWIIQRLVKDLQLLTNKCIVFSCAHVYRKANSTTDILEKHSHNQDIIKHYCTYNQLPQDAKGSYFLEKIGVQNFRHRKVRKIKQPP